MDWDGRSAGNKSFPLIVEALSSLIPLSFYFKL
jgi:hypothetical protein